MNDLLIFCLNLIIHTFILYVITAKILILDQSGTSLLKAFIVTLIIDLFYYFVPAMINIPSGFQAEMFARISRYMLTLIPYIFIKIVYRMDWKNFLYFLIANFALRFLAGLLILNPLLKLFIN